MMSEINPHTLVLLISNEVGYCAQGIGWAWAHTGTQPCSQSQIHRHWDTQVQTYTLTHHKLYCASKVSRVLHCKDLENRSLHMRASLKALINARIESCTILDNSSKGVLNRVMNVHVLGPKRPWLMERLIVHPGAVWIVHPGAVYLWSAAQIGVYASSFLLCSSTSFQHVYQTVGILPAQ